MTTKKTQSNTFQHWLESVTANDQYDSKLLTKAYQLAIQIRHSEKSQQSLLDTGLNIASELVTLNCDTQTLAAAILYPSFHRQIVDQETFCNQLDNQIWKLLIGTQHMDAIDQLKKQTTEFSQQQDQSDNLRKMLLAIVDDIRIVLIKLAERLVTLREARNKPEVMKQALALQVMNLYAPLANRLGIGQFKWQMEDFAFSYLQPESYADISKALKMRRTERENYIHDLLKALNLILKENNITNAEISGRAKHIYSIYRKIKRKQVDFNQIYDTNAVRILVSNIDECYTALSLVHAKWEHIPQEFDDYIAKPKPNGYRSVHTAVIGPNNINIEIQIRTYQMHNEAELGVAAHWKYKEGTTGVASFEEKINLLRDMMSWQKEVSEEDTSNQNLYNKLFEDRIYVFTPNGDVLDMSQEATPLDFAYHIHTEVGHRCRGAKVNGKIVPLTRMLITGDKVEIITTKVSQPSRDWLNKEQGYLKTHHARNKVRHWFKKQSQHENIEHGQLIWEKQFRRHNLTKRAILQVVSRFNFNSIEELYAAIGAGDIGINTVINRIKFIEKPEIEEKSETPIDISTIKPAKKSYQSPIQVLGTDDLLTQLARCCQPIPGDDILGYITKGRGITIHKSGCFNIKQAQRYRPQRVLPATWGESSLQKYPVDLNVIGDDRPGLMRDITTIIANEKIALIGANCRVNKLENRNYIQLTIEISNLEPLKKIISQIKQLPSVIEVARRR